MKIIESPHPPAPSPKFGRRGARAKSGVSCLEKVLHLGRPQDRIFRCSLSQTWERAGVRAFTLSSNFRDLNNSPIVVLNQKIQRLLTANFVLNAASLDAHQQQI
jgi:hypothetical protein